MKLVLTLLALCALIVFSESCTKEVAVPVTDTLVVHHVDTIYIAQPTSIFGLWIGTYDVTGGPDAGKKGFHYSYELHKDHSVQATAIGADGLTAYGVGTWKLQDGTVFSASITTTNSLYAGMVQTVKGTYDSTNSMLTGTVTNDFGPYYEATFTMEKVQ